MPVTHTNTACLLVSNYLLQDGQQCWSIFIPIHQVLTNVLSSLLCSISKWSSNLFSRQMWWCIINVDLNLEWLVVYPWFTFFLVLLGMVDVIFADVAQPDQTRIVALNAHNFLKNGGHFVISIKVWWDATRLYNIFTCCAPPLCLKSCSVPWFVMNLNFLLKSWLVPSYFWERLTAGFFLS